MIRIIAESTCDLSLETLGEWGVEVLPMYVTLDGTEYLDRVDISPKEFFAKLETSQGMPSTAQVTPKRYEDIMRDVQAKGEEALFLVFSSELSGSYQACLIAQQTFDDLHIKIVDTKAASAGQGLIVHEIVKMAKEGASLEELYNRAVLLSHHIEHLVLVDSLEMLKRGGRVSGVAAFMGGVMNIKPLLHMVDGKLIPFAKAKGSKKALKMLVEETKRRGKGLEDQTIFIAHGDNLEGAEALIKELEETLGLKHFYVTELGATIGSHTGKGVIAFFFFNEIL